jgi:hypothetical protein
VVTGSRGPSPPLRLDEEAGTASDVDLDLDSDSESWANEDPGESGEVYRFEEDPVEGGSTLHESIRNWKGADGNPHPILRKLTRALPGLSQPQSPESKCWATRSLGPVLYLGGETIKQQRNAMDTNNLLETAYGVNSAFLFEKGARGDSDPRVRVVTSAMRVVEGRAYKLREGDDVRCASPAGYMRIVRMYQVTTTEASGEKETNLWFEPRWFWKDKVLWPFIIRHRVLQCPIRHLEEPLVMGGTRNNLCHAETIEEQVWAAHFCRRVCAKIPHLHEQLQRGRRRGRGRQRAGRGGRGRGGRGGARATTGGGVGGAEGGEVGAGGGGGAKGGVTGGVRTAGNQRRKHHGLSGSVGLLMTAAAETRLLPTGAGPAGVVWFTTILRARFSAARTASLGPSVMCTQLDTTRRTQCLAQVTDFVLTTRPCTNITILLLCYYY